MLKKSTFREIKNSLSRYLAILAIVALGVGFFSGLKVIQEAMVTTADNYLKEQNLYDYQIMSTLGFEEKDVQTLAENKDIVSAEGSVSTDALYYFDGDESNKVMSFHSITSDINQLKLKAGRMPEKANECVIDHNLIEEDEIGKTIIISSENDKDTSKLFKYKEYTIVGTVVSPLYLNFERGTTSLGNGTITGFTYLSLEGFDTDYFTEIYVDIDSEGMIYSSAYENDVEHVKDSITATAEKAADNRYQRIIKDAKEELADGQKEYDENYAKYITEKADAEKELSDAYKKLTDSQTEINENRKKLQDTKKELLTTKTDLTSKQKEALANKADLEEKKTTLIQAKASIEEGQKQLATKRAEFEAAKPYMTAEQIAATETELSTQEGILSAQYTEVTTNLTLVESGLLQVNDGLSQISSGLTEVGSGLTKVESSLRKLDEGQKEVDEGFEDYYEGKSEAETEFADAEKEFADARLDLEEAEDEINDIEAPDTYVLNRNTNVGYACYENDAAIVDGIARVFPVFFFLVAALVCMTTMTRMVDEQRTQIGVLKALGYSNGAISAKYLFYSGSAAFMGCVIGFFGGCWLFPKVIWIAYGMMYDFSAEIVYIFDPILAVICLIVALLCSMGATMFSCYADFGEVPAQLIRPKTPKDGKRILLERIGFIWNRLSFLYKVSFRNIFRYKKRFFMMVLGISGCTALLVAGFGIIDSVKNVVNDQFDYIQLYDCSVTFDKEMTEKRQERFVIKTEDDVEDLIFVYQNTADMLADGREKEINLISAEESCFGNYIDFHTVEGEPITYPSKGEAVICNNLADDYNVDIGGTIILRDEDHKEMEVTVSGIYQNYVYNYVFIAPETMEDGWGYQPEYKTAYVHVNAEKDDTDAIHQIAAKMMNENRVVTVTVNNDQRDRVNSMMESLNYVIVLIIVCAGALAFIVLYNLTNINITERIREIATIKVLGFYPNETSAYVFRENIFLTGISAVVGLFLGKVFLSFVIGQVQVDLMCFDDKITPLSYLYAFLLTFVFSAFVSMVMYFKLEKISMTESLKSIE